MKVSQKKVIEALKKHHGSISKAARELEITSRTIYKYRDKYPKIREALESSREDFDSELLDLAESKLKNAIAASEPWAIKYALQTKGRTRGYVDKKEIEHSGEIKQIVIEMDTSL